jgi:hypothetical protein
MLGGENMKTQIVRWGDIALEKIDALPTGLKKATTHTVLQTGSSGHPHKVENCDIYFKNVSNYIIGYLVVKKNGKLLHAEHGKYVKGRNLKEGSIREGTYAIRRQQEKTHEGMRPVVD